MGLVLPETVASGRDGASIRRRSAAGLSLLRGAGVVSSGARAAWVPPLRPRVGARDDVLEELALRLDAAAVRLARGRGAVDLAIGEALALLFDGDRLRELGYNRRVDFARERLGIPTRTMYAFVELARAVADLPDLRLAVIRGEVSARKAKALAPALRNHPERAEFYLAIGRTKTLPEIEQILADLGEEVPEDAFETRTRRFRMSAEMQEHLDGAIELAKVITKFGRPRFYYEEAIAMEFLAAHADLVPEPVDAPPPRPPSSFPPSPDDRARLLAEWEDRDTREIEETLRVLLAGEIDFVTGKRTVPATAVELQARILRLLAFRARWDEPFGRILETISTLRLHTFLGYPSFTAWAVGRLGISERGARQRVWLERKMAKLPELRMALRTGRLTYSKALVVAKDATRRNVKRLIRKAAVTTYQQMRRESDDREDRQNLAHGIRRIWGPVDAMETIETAIRVAKEVAYRRTGARITDGEAYGLVAIHFEEQWRDPVRRGRLPPLKRKVFARTRGICATPGCGNPADHMHHIVYRSNGGPDEAWNCTYVCSTCHRRIHRGRMEVRGRAGERLVWRIRREKGRWEVWETIGDDDVRKLGESAPLP